MTQSITHCPDCQREMNLFGICPKASLKDAAIMAAPVSCGAGWKLIPPASDRQALPIAA